MVTKNEILTSQNRIWKILSSTIYLELPFRHDENIFWNKQNWEKKKNAEAKKYQTIKWRKHNIAVAKDLENYWVLTEEILKINQNPTSKQGYP